ncbi:MAG: ATP-binding protein [Gammaproteobacteria bacterium]|nr:ATP-binding protein [Gammaproteobacteria bacterium]
MIFPWRGPGGPFLLPMELLAVSSSAKIVLTLLLAPTSLQSRERTFLATMATLAQSLSEQRPQAYGNNAPDYRADPVAGLAGQMYMAHWRRLSAEAFLVLVQCAADGGRLDLARTVASGIQATVYEQPLVSGDPATLSLPTGACAYFADPDSDECDRQQRIYEQLTLAAAIDSHPQGRLPLLVDAVGAATVFRLPVSVRGGVPGIPVRQSPPDFHPGPRWSQPPANTPSVHLGDYEGGGGAFLPVCELDRHVLVTGFTGSGKTVTLMQLLSQLWCDHGIPFLVLEPAKQEYRGLIGVKAFLQAPAPLRVYTLGRESCLPFRLNPFELLPGVRVEAHIARLQTCFEAAIPPLGPSSSVIAEALHWVYRRWGWQLTDSGPEPGQAIRRFPTLSDYSVAIERVVKSRGYQGEVRDNVLAALVGRFKPLLMGGKGMMFDTQRCNPAPDVLFTTPTILEMDDLNGDEKALAVMFLLMLLREHRVAHPGAGRLQHITVVEEAHNVLAATPATAGGADGAKADTRHKAVETLCNLLTEIRAFGEGIVIADQSPQKLARDAISNTNLHIAHQLRDADDRQAIANAILMDEEQKNYLGKIERGFAAFFHTGLEKATFIKIPPYAEGRGKGFNPQVTDTEVRNYMIAHGLFDPSLQHIEYPYSGCEYCHQRCHFMEALYPVTVTDKARASGTVWFRQVDSNRHPEETAARDFWNQAAARAVVALLAANIPVDEDALWCHFVHTWHFATFESDNLVQEILLSIEHRRMLLNSLAWLKRDRNASITEV